MTSWDTIGAAASVVGIMISLDVISGVASAASRGDLQTPILRRGLMHKLALVIAVALAVALEYATDVLPIDVTIPLVIPVCSYIAIMEACSVYENIKKMNPDVRIDNFEDLFNLNKGNQASDAGELPEEFVTAMERYMQKFIDEQEAHENDIRK